MNIKNFLFGSSVLSNAGDIGALVARLGFGLYMSLGHGLAKMPPPEQLVGGLENMGLPMPGVMAWCAALAECVAAFLVAIGLLTRPAAIAVVITMAVAAFTAHAKDPWVSQGGASKEMAMLYLLAFASIAFIGAGRFSVDSMLRRNQHSDAAHPQH